jgi:hypothetical protein
VEPVPELVGGDPDRVALAAQLHRRQFAAGDQPPDLALAEAQPPGRPVDDQ